MERQPGEESQRLTPYVVPDKTVLTVLITNIQSIFIVATPSDPTDIIDNFWLPSTIISGAKTKPDLQREAKQLTTAWTGFTDLKVDPASVMSANMPYPLTPPGVKSNSVLYGTIFMSVLVGLPVSGQVNKFVPHSTLLEAALADDEFQFRGSWLSKENVRASLSHDMEVMRPIRKVLGLGPEVPSVKVEYRMCKFHPDTLTIGGKGCQRCATRRNRFRA